MLKIPKQMYPAEFKSPAVKRIKKSLGIVVVTCELEMSKDTTQLGESRGLGHVQ